MFEILLRKQHRISQAFIFLPEFHHTHEESDQNPLSLPEVHQVSQGDTNEDAGHDGKGEGELFRL